MQLREISINPITMSNGKGEIFECDVEVCSVTADNLAMNQMMGIPCGFSNSQCCQFSTIKFGTFNVPIVERDLDQLNHVFIDIPFIGRLYSPDLFHDINEASLHTLRYVSIF